MQPRLYGRVRGCSAKGGSAQDSHAWRDANDQPGMSPKKKRPSWSHSNDKIERCHRTLADGWAHAEGDPLGLRPRGRLWSSLGCELAHRV